VYHYEKLADILYRVAVLFEPPPEEKKPRRKKTESTYDKMSREVMNNLDVKPQKKPKRFPLGDAILKSLPNTDPGISIDRVVEKTGTPKPYGMHIWGGVMGKLVKRGLVRMNTFEGEKVYRRAK
jgi:hypothetical protein